MTVLWSINDRNGAALPLNDKEVHLYYTCERGRFEADIEIQDGNVVIWHFYGRQQRALGSYTLTLEILQSQGKRSIKKDICNAFVLVGKECEEKYCKGEAHIKEGGEITLVTDLDIYRISPIIPEIGPNGNWWVDGIDTGKRGEQPTIELGENDNWIINGVDTGISSRASFSVSYSELKDLRDRGELSPGKDYRIIDYVAKENGVAETFKANRHLFDIIVRANNNNSLSEVARACRSERRRIKCRYDFGDDTTAYVIVYNISINTYIAGNDPSTSRDYYKCEDESTGEIFYSQVSPFDILASYGYLMRYTLDGSVLKAADKSYYLAWGKDEPSSVSDECTNLEGWKLWYCLDNDSERFAWAQPDEKIIKLYARGYTSEVKRVPEKDAEINGKMYYCWEQISGPLTNSWTDTLDLPLGRYSGYSSSGSIDSSTTFIVEEKKGSRGVIYRMIDDKNNDLPYDFKSIKLWNYLTQTYDYAIPSGCRENVIHAYQLKDSSTLQLGKVILGQDCIGNIIGSSVDDCILGNQCSNNTLGSYCTDIRIGDGSCNNIIGNNVAMCDLGGSCEDIDIQNGCQNILIGTETKQVIVGAGTQDISIGGNSKGITIGADCRYIYFGVHCSSIRVGNDCISIRLMKSEEESRNDLENIYIGNGVSYIYSLLPSDARRGDLIIDDGICGKDEGNPYDITEVLDDSQWHTKPIMHHLAYNMHGQIVTYCMADLIKVQ